jgi:pyruvate kinase
MMTSQQTDKRQMAAESIESGQRSDGRLARRNRGAKIVATIGPASQSAGVLRDMLFAGADIFRLNFSHGSHDLHRQVHREIRRLEHEVSRPIGVIQDLQGPKIRVGLLSGGGRVVKAGEIVQFRLTEVEGDENWIPLPHPEVFAAIVPGTEFLVDDGRLRFVVEDCNSDSFRARVLVGGDLLSRKGLNLPRTFLDISPLTTRDKEDLAFGLDLGVDWIALSFVQKPSDLIEARALVADRAALISKIEKPHALAHIDNIVALSDAIMVARGDLGVEIEQEEVPGRQKELVRLCRQAGKPVIVATQMLDSMVNSPAPTRAETSDVATAVYDGADAVMLSAESATGRYPVAAVSTMSRIISRTEQSLISAVQLVLEQNPPHIVAASAASLAAALDASAVVAFTSSGTTAVRVARQRPRVPIIAITPSEGVARRLCLLWGAHSILAEEIGAYEEMVEQAISHSLESEFSKINDHIVVVAGLPFATAGTTNNVRVVRIDRHEPVQRTKSITQVRTEAQEDVKSIRR